MPSLSHPLCLHTSQSESNGWESEGIIPCLCLGGILGSNYRSDSLTNFLKSIGIQTKSTVVLCCAQKEKAIGLSSSPVTSVLFAFLCDWNLLRRQCNTPLAHTNARTRGERERERERERETVREKGIESMHCPSAETACYARTRTSEHCRKKERRMRCDADPSRPHRLSAATPMHFGTARSAQRRNRDACASALGRSIHPCALSPPAVPSEHSLSRSFLGSPTEQRDTQTVHAWHAVQGCSAVRTSKGWSRSRLLQQGGGGGGGGATTKPKNVKRCLLLLGGGGGGACSSPPSPSAPGRANCSCVCFIPGPRPPGSTIVSA